MRARSAPFLLEVMLRTGFVCHACGERVAVPLEREGQFYHQACWEELQDEEAAKETPEDAQAAWEETIWDEEREGRPG